MAIDANNNFEATSVAPKMHNLTDEHVNVVNTTQATSIIETSSNEYYSSTPKMDFSTTTSKVPKLAYEIFLSKQFNCLKSTRMKFYLNNLVVIVN